MKDNLKKAFQRQIKDARMLILDNKLEEAFKSLEKAHILGQKYVIPHLISHLYMLRIAVIKKDY